MSTTNVPLKLSYDGVIRRAQFPVNEGFDCLCDVIAKLYPTALKGAVVSYVDDDGDEIHVSTDGDLVAAFHCFRQGTVGKALRLNVSNPTAPAALPEDKKPAVPVVVDPTKPSISLLHSGVHERASFTETPEPASRGTSLDSEESDEDGFELVKSVVEQEQASPAEEDGGPASEAEVKYPTTTLSQVVRLFEEEEEDGPVPVEEDGAVPVEPAEVASVPEDEKPLATDEKTLSLEDYTLTSTLDAIEAVEAVEAVEAFEKAAEKLEKQDLEETPAATVADDKLASPADKKVAAVEAKPAVPDVPLRATAGGALIYPDGTVEFGMGGDAVLLPDGQTVSCILSYKGFPSVAAKDLLLTSGKWYYEAVVLTSGLMQIGWCDALFAGDSNEGEGVGDDEHSYSYDGFRQKAWHKQNTHTFGQRWSAGDVVCCAVDIDKGSIRFALNGQWEKKRPVEAFSGACFPHGLMPAASFSKGEKLCFNFGANGFVHAPPDAEYAAVHSAYGTGANQYEKVEVVPVPVITYMPPPASKTTPAAAAAAAPKPPAPATEQLAALLLKEDVREALSRFLGHPDIAKSLQHIMVAVLTDPRMVNNIVTSQVEVLMPLFLQLVSEQPALMGLLPNILSMLGGLGNQPPSCEKPREREGPRACPRGRRCHQRQGQTARKGNPSKHGMAKCPFKQVTSPFVAAMDTAFGLTRPEQKAAARCPWATAKAAAPTPKAAAPARKPEAFLRFSETSSCPYGAECAFTHEKAAFGWGKPAPKPAASAFGWGSQNCAPRKAAAPAPKPAASAFGWGSQNCAPPKAAAPAPKAPAVLKPAKSAAMVKVPDLVAAAATEAQRPRCKFIEQSTFDVETGSIVDLCACKPGQRVAHTWTMVNPADISWSKGNVAKRVSGDEIIKTPDFAFNSEVTAHQPIHITVEAVAPATPGRYVDYWRLHDNAKQPFGDRIWLDMTVV